MLLKYRLQFLLSLEKKKTTIFQIVKTEFIQKTFTEKIQDLAQSWQNLEQRIIILQVSELK